MSLRLAIAAVLCAASMHADTLLVANRSGTTITLINPFTMQSLGTVTVGFDPHEIAVSADGRTAYVSNTGGGAGSTISVIDVATLEKIRDISISPLLTPHGIVERNGKIWFTAENSRAVGRYDPLTDRIDWVGQTNQFVTHELVVNRSGTTVYTANVISASVSIIDVGTGQTATARKNIPTVPLSEGIAMTPDERELWVGSAGTGGISVISTQSESVVATISPGLFAYRIYFTHDGRYALVPRGTGVVVYDTATREIVRTLTPGGQPLSVLIAPDDQMIWVATTNPARVVKMAFENGQILGSVDVASIPDGLAMARTPAVEPVPSKRRRSVRNG